MKTRYVLLTALSALLVGAGANAATDLKVATQAYTDSHLASKDIATPTAEATGKVVTYNGTKFDYTDKGAVMPTGTAAGQMLKWDATNSKWVAETGLSAGEAIEIKEDGSVNVKYDGAAVQKNSNNQLTVPEMTGVTSSSGPEGKAGLVPAPDRGQDDWVKFLRGDGTWAADRDTTYQAGAGLSQTGEGENRGLNVNVDNQTIIINDQDQLAAVPAAPYTAANGIDITDNKVSVKKDTTVTNNALVVDATNGVSVKYDNTTIKNGDNGLYAVGFTGADNRLSGDGGQNGKPGLVPEAQAGIDNNKFLRGDGTWATPTDDNTEYDGINGVKSPVLNASTGKYEFDVKTDTTVTNNALSVGANGVSVKYDGSTVKSGTNGLYLDIDGTTIKYNETSGKLEAAQVDAYTKTESDARYDELGAAKAVQGETTTTVKGVEGIMGERVAGNYYAATDTLAEADKKLDAQIKLNADAIATKATAATTLAGYGITDAYTKTETDSAITTKVDALDATVSQTAGSDGLALQVVETDGKLTSVTGSIAANTYDAYGAASAVQGETTATVKDLETEIDSMDATESQTAAAANGWLNLEVKEVDGVITSVAGSIESGKYVSAPTTNCAIGHMCALVQSGSDAPVWVDLTAIGGTEPNLQY